MKQQHLTAIDTGAGAFLVRRDEASLKLFEVVEVRGGARGFPRPTGRGLIEAGLRSRWKPRTDEPFLVRRDEASLKLRPASLVLGPGFLSSSDGTRPH